MMLMANQFNRFIVEYHQRVKETMPFITHMIESYLPTIRVRVGVILPQWGSL